MSRTFIALVLLVVLLGITGADQLDQGSFNDGIIRLHVVANSDSSQDQALKLQVKDKVVALMRRELEGTKTLDQARSRTRESLLLIQKVAQAEVTRQGYDYPVRVSMGEYEFPTRFYGNLVFPQGRYEAVRVVIGDGNGRNWWCVLFPPLCLVSSQEQGLTLNADSGYEVRLKLREIWQKEVRVTSN